MWLFILDKSSMHNLIHGGILAFFVTCCAAVLGSEHAVSIVDVEGQPLASNARRLSQALDAIGNPLPMATKVRLAGAIKNLDAEEIQRCLDPHVLAIVSISPEERVSVKRGPVDAILQQAGYQPTICKIINQSTSTSRLRITSPQAGPHYAGVASLSMRRQQQTELGKNQNVNRSRERFLQIDVYRDAPMSEKLSGLEVEYAIVLFASSEAGRREAVLQFDIGEGTADLERRNELAVLFNVKPAIPLHLSVIDDDGAPGIARLVFRDALGRIYPPQAKRASPDFFFQTQVYRQDGESVLLPPGRFQVEYGRGPEYRVLRTNVDIKENNENRLELRLKRWIHPRSFGYISGDHHIHAAGCAHYAYPTEGVTPEVMFRQVRGEGLNVGCVLTWGPCFDFQRQFFGPAARSFGTDDTLLKYDLEISGFGSQSLGHVCLLNLRNQTYPNSNGTKDKGWPTWTTPVMRWAKEQGGYAGYAHSASGLWIDPESATARILEGFDANGDGALSKKEATAAFLPFDFAAIDANRSRFVDEEELRESHRRASEELPNFAIPEMNGVGAMEICVSTVAGVCDFISAMDTRRIQEWNTWYHLLNCGFSIKVSGETDFPCMSSRRVGQGRVYVHLGRDAPIDFDRWCQGLAEGRSYVSDGYAHVVNLSVNGESPGRKPVHLSKPGTVQILAEIAFAPEVPKGVAYGTEDPIGGRAVVGDTVELHGRRSDDWVQGGVRKVEIVVNGLPVAIQEVPADGRRHRIAKELPIEQSSWVALRHFPQLHSNPVDVIVGKRPIRASRESARWCIEMTELLWKNREKRIAEHERGAAKKAFDLAIATLKEIEASSVSTR